MSKISQSESIKGIEKEIGGVKLMFYPANIDDLEYMMDLEGGDKMPCPHCQKELSIPSKDLTVEERSEFNKRRSKALSTLALNALKEADPEADEKELKRFCMKNIQEIMEAIMEVNQLKDAAA